MTKKAETNNTTTKETTTMEKAMKKDILNALLRDADKRSKEQDASPNARPYDGTTYDPNEPASQDQLDYLVSLNYKYVYRMKYNYPEGPVLTKREAKIAIDTLLKYKDELATPRKDKLGYTKTLYNMFIKRYPENNFKVKLDNRPASDGQVKRIVMNLFRYEITDLRKPEGTFLSITDACEYIELLEANAKDAALRPYIPGLYQELYAALDAEYPDTHITLVCDNVPEVRDMFMDDPFAEIPEDKEPLPPKAPKTTKKYDVTKCASSGQPKTLADTAPAEKPKAKTTKTKKA